MTDSKQKIKNLENQIDILNTSLNASEFLTSTGSWNWNVKTNEVTWSDNMFIILGLEPNSIEPSYDLAFDHVHDSDKEKYEDTLNTALTNKTSYFLENRITKKDNSVIHVISRGNCLLDTTDNLIQMYGTVQDVSTQKELERVTKEKVRAEEADRVRAMFLAIISHELKHPFLILKNYSTLFINSFKQDDQTKALEYADIIKKTSHETFRAINNLLEWTRANSSKLTYNPETINLKQFIDNIILTFKFDTKQKNITLQVDEHSNTEVCADKNVLSILFMHLIENAIKFSNRNGQIIISAISKEKEFEFSVADDGVGIELEFQEELFKLDNLFSTSGTNGELGTGIGLKLCKTLVEKHNGTLLIHSEIHKGTTCVFTLPI